MTLRLRAAVTERDVEVELAVETGGTLALLGPNGAGKSTALGLLAGLVRPDSGTARLDDVTLFDVSADGARRVWTPPHRRGVALLAQDPLLFPHLSVRHNVEFGPRSTGDSREGARERARTWLARTGTTHLAERRPDDLSGGQAQRVAIARALATEPRLLLLDEPLAALDVSVAAELRGMLADVLAERTTIVVTHDALDAYLLADRVAVLHDGRVVEEGPTRRVLERPRYAFTAELSGLTLLTGHRSAEGITTEDGLSLRGVVAEPIAVGSRTNAVVRPSAVRVGPDGVVPRADASDALTAEVNRIPATVIALEPQADLVRVRTDRLDALVSPARVADLSLAPGRSVTLSVDAADVPVYRA